MAKRVKAANAAVASSPKVRRATAPVEARAEAPKPAPPPVPPIYPELAARVPHPSPANVGLAWRPMGSGGGELRLAYEGPLAGAETLQVRTGTYRAGDAPWAELRDVRLIRERPGRFVGTVTVPGGVPVEAVELAFHAGDAWDNGGLAPLGYYEWSVGQRQLAVR